MGRNKVFDTKNDWKKFVKKNATIAFNVFYPYKEKHVLILFQKIILKRARNKDNFFFFKKRSY